MRSIIVLEDMRVRVDALRRACARDVNIIHCESVGEFIDAFESADDVIAVILDHDLGEEGTFAGASGYGYAEVGNGMGAVTYLTRQERRLPVFVWSVNVVARRRMTHVLGEAGFDVHECSFREDVPIWIVGVIGLADKA